MMSSDLVHYLFDQTITGLAIWLIAMSVFAVIRWTWIGFRVDLRLMAERRRQKRELRTMKRAEREARLAPRPVGQRREPPIRRAVRGAAL